MLDSSDIETVRSIRLLFDEVRRNERPIAFWVGAGASSWCGYPRWPELADHFHSDFLRHESAYDSNLGLKLLSQGNFPELFQACRNTDSQRFYRLLADSFSARPATPVYKRFAAAIGAIGPPRVFTTNVDNLLER